MSMNYTETLAFLFEQLPMFQRQGAAAYKDNLDNTEAFCSHLGHPERAYPSIHIAGTNGKGSVSHMTASFLQENKLNVGLYTSPHLKDFRERIRVNGEMISEDYVVDFVHNHRDFIMEMKPSFFEITFAMAIAYFQERKVDFAVMETGMGGRLDSTNVVRSVLSVITNISLDHTQFLGDTIPKIAIEKAGIIKPNVPIVIGQNQEESLPVFKTKAQEKGTDLFLAEEVVELNHLELGFDAIRCEAEDKLNACNFLNIQCPLAGAYQVHNINTFIAVAAVMKSKVQPSLDLGKVEVALEKVITNTGMQGRWQVIGKKPLCIADTGHNEAGLEIIAEQLKKQEFENLHFVLGMVSDKSIDQLLALLPKNATYYFCKADIPRALGATELMNKAQKMGLQGEVYSSVMSAYKMALKKAEEKDLVFVGGSTFVVAEILP